MKGMGDFSPNRDSKFTSSGAVCVVEFAEDEWDGTAKAIAHTGGIPVFFVPVYFSRLLIRGGLAVGMTARSFLRDPSHIPRSRSLENSCGFPGGSRVFLWITNSLWCRVSLSSGVRDPTRLRQPRLATPGKLPQHDERNAESGRPEPRNFYLLSFSVCSIQCPISRHPQVEAMRLS